MMDYDPTHFPFVVREAWRYRHCLPEGVSLNEATPQQWAEAIHRGQAEEALHPDWYTADGYTAWFEDEPTVVLPPDDGPTTIEMAPITDDDDGLNNTLVYDRVCFGHPAEIAGARASLRRWLGTDCPQADDVVLVASELAANAVRHSASANLYFILRVEIHPDHVRVECDDLGGPWGVRAVDDLPRHGLDIVSALSADWGTEERRIDSMRVVWAKIAAPQGTKLSAACLSRMAAPFRPADIRTIHGPTLRPISQSLNASRRGRAWPRPTPGGDRIA